MLSSTLVVLALASSTLAGTIDLTARNSCTCPLDKKSDYGVLINVLDAYQCAYSGGACTWLAKSGDLQNTHQTNCPAKAPCSAYGCKCPEDKNYDYGTLIREFKAFQCAYPHGACAWDKNNGELLNTFQTNCVTNAKCYN